MYMSTLNGCSGVVLIFNIEWISQLVLTRELVVGIYNGTVNKWNDPAIVSLNPTVIMPATDIIVTGRSDSSGTTRLFTAALSSFSSAWNSTYGTFDDGLTQDHKPIRWNGSVVTLWGRSSSGMIGVVYSYQYSIGYVSVATAVVGNFTHVLLVNKAGKLLFRTYARVLL